MGCLGETRTTPQRQPPAPEPRQRGRKRRRGGHVTDPLRHFQHQRLGRAFGGRRRRQGVAAASACFPVRGNALIHCTSILILYTYWQGMAWIRCGGQPPTPFAGSPELQSLPLPMRMLHQAMQICPLRAQGKSASRMQGVRIDSVPFHRLVLEIQAHPPWSRRALRLGLFYETGPSATSAAAAPTRHCQGYGPS